MSSPLKKLLPARPRRDGFRGATPTPNERPNRRPRNPLQNRAIRDRRRPHVAGFTFGNRVTSIAYVVSGRRVRSKLETGNVFLPN
jgi:hypothetical protein